MEYIYQHHVMCHSFISLWYSVLCRPLISINASSFSLSNTRASLYVLGGTSKAARVWNSVALLSNVLRLSRLSAGVSILLSLSFCNYKNVCECSLGEVNTKTSVSVHSVSVHSVKLTSEAKLENVFSSTMCEAIENQGYNTHISWA